MAKKSFAKQVKKFGAKYRKIMFAVPRQSVTDLANLVQTPRAKGGHLPVDTSFLRNSFLAALGSPPSGPGKEGDGKHPKWTDGPLIVILSKWTGQKLVLGYVARYARAMEFLYGFNRLAAQKWPEIVKANVARAKREIR